MTIKLIFVLYSSFWNWKISGDYTCEVTPDPIPNSEVKLIWADGTWTAGSRESRSLPDSLYKQVCRNMHLLFCLQQKKCSAYFVAKQLYFLACNFVFASFEYSSLRYHFSTLQSANTSFQLKNWKFWIAKNKSNKYYSFNLKFLIKKYISS